MKGTNLLVGAILALAATVILALTVSYGNSREPGSRLRQVALTGTDPGPVFAQRGTRTRVLPETKHTLANAGRNRHGPATVTVALVD